MLVLKAQVAATGALSTTERSHPTSEVRVRSQEDPMPEGRQPRGITPRPRSGAAAERSYPASKVRGCGGEEIPGKRGQGRRLGGPTTRLRSGAVAGRTNPTPETMGSGLEELPHTPTPEARGSGLEELPHA